MSDPPAATSKRRKAGVPAAVLRSMTSPLPTMVRSSPAAMTGSPVGPSVVLSTAVSVNVLPAASVIVSASAVALAALMAATSSADARGRVAGRHGPAFEPLQVRASSPPPRDGPPGRPAIRTCLAVSWRISGPRCGLRSEEKATAPGAQAERPCRTHASSVGHSIGNDDVPSLHVSPWFALAVSNRGLRPLRAPDHPPLHERTGRPGSSSRHRSTTRPRGGGVG